MVGLLVNYCVRHVVKSKGSENVSAWRTSLLLLPRQKINNQDQYGANQRATHNDPQSALGWGRIHFCSPQPDTSLTLRVVGLKTSELRECVSQCRAARIFAKCHRISKRTVRFFRDRAFFRFFFWLRWYQTLTLTLKP